MSESTISITSSSSNLLQSSRNLQQDDNSQQQTKKNVVTIAGVFDTTSFDWGEELLNFTVAQINADNYFLDDDTVLEWDLVNAACDANTAAQAYWNDIRSVYHAGSGLHGIVGCRCSGASIAVARIASLEQVPQISPSSTSAQLSDKQDYPTFSRVVAPDTAVGQVGAMVAMLRSLGGWNRVSILATDTDYAKDFANEFRRLWLVQDYDQVYNDHVNTDESMNTVAWEGEIAYTGTIVLNADQEIDPVAVRQVLADMPTDDPGVNSKIILLLAHDQHAFPILEIAREMNFQPDTIWVGPEAWAGRQPRDGRTDWMPDYPGYLGVIPLRNHESKVYQAFLSDLQREQHNSGREVWTSDSFPDYAAGYLVDSVLALAKALAAVPHEQRLNGTAVSTALRQLQFEGVTGQVSFTPQGDRRNARFTIINLQPAASQDDDGIGFVWKDVGHTGTEVGDTFWNEGVGGICFAEVGCNLEEPPSDKYPVPILSDSVKVWVVVVMVVIALLLIAVAFKYYRTRQKKKELKKSITEIQKKMEEMKNIDNELDDLDEQVEKAKRRQQALILKRAQLQETPDTWSEADETLVEVPPEDEQYWTVADRMKETMPDAHISKLWRVQNVSLWTYYSFHRDRLAMHQIDSNERSVWHGTSNLEPSVIYNDRQDGFMMQFAAQGFWGRGIYFAHKAEYSHNYAHKPQTQSSSWGFGFTSSNSNAERPDAQEGEREMFLAKLLVGNSIRMNRDESHHMAEKCRKLTVPPTDARTNLKYNTVTGDTAGSQVWIVYENGRAYPDYLVRYYRGTRDPKRTPYRSKKDAMKNVNKKPKDEQPAALAKTAPSSSGSDAQSSDSAIWEFQDNSGWTAYADDHQAILEDGYVAFLTKSGGETVQIQTDEWKYEVNLKTKTQKNLQHSAGTERPIRRRAVMV